MGKNTSRLENRMLAKSVGLQITYNYDLKCELKSKEAIRLSCFFFKVVHKNVNLLANLLALCFKPWHWKHIISQQDVG